LIGGRDEMTKTLLERDFGVKFEKRTLPPQEEIDRLMANRVRAELIQESREDEITSFLRLAEAMIEEDGTREILAFLERTRDTAVLPIVGMSGAGKSSFIMAGVLPRLRERGAWTVLQLRPGAKPFVALARALLAGDQRVSGRVISTVAGADFHGKSAPEQASVEREEERLAHTLRQNPAQLAQLLLGLGGNFLLLPQQIAGNGLRDHVIRRLLRRDPRQENRPRVVIPRVRVNLAVPPEI
jgi:hypothetical protein